MLPSVERSREDSRIGNEQVDGRTAVEGDQPLADGLTVAHIGHAGFRDRAPVAARLGHLLQALFVTPDEGKRSAGRGIILRKRSANSAGSAGDCDDLRLFRHAL